MPIKILIYGAGGHAKNVIDTLTHSMTDADLIVVDENSKVIGTNVMGYNVVSTDELQKIKFNGFHIAIGHCKVRERLSVELSSKGHQPETIAHTSAFLSSYANIGIGSYISANVFVGAETKIGEGVLLNHSCVVDHDCHIGAFCHIAPNVTLSGNVTIGKRVLVGSGACVLPGVTIGDDAVVGAGAVVTSDVMNGAIVSGVPAKPR